MTVGQLIDYLSQLDQSLEVEYESCYSEESGHTMTSEVTKIESCYGIVTLS